jgi:hypothetical protein
MLAHAPHGDEGLGLFAEEDESQHVDDLEPPLRGGWPPHVVLAGPSRRDRHRIWLVAALISVVIIVAITAVGTQLQTTFNSVSTALAGANN